jgi:hypothetical protein
MKSTDQGVFAEAGELSQVSLLRTWTGGVSPLLSCSPALSCATAGNQTCRPLFRDRQAASIVSGGLLVPTEILLRAEAVQ